MRIWRGLGLAAMLCCAAIIGCDGTPATPDDGGGGPMDGGGERDGGGGDSGREPGCGDGLVSSSEECDDGNEDPDDGCDDACVVEAGWECDLDEPTTCDEVCGDGETVGAEAGTDGCDDGDRSSGDGCSSRCEVEAGYACGGEPSVCMASCGDGAIVSGIEECDDGDAAGGDGCSASCDVEEGFDCSGEPSVCSTTCGDEVIAGSEACDDGNTASETACPYGMLTCTLCNATCTATLSLTGAACGDGTLNGAEVCDDANTTTETSCAYGTATCSGCSADCSMALALTGPRCGDGLVASGRETCDDGNTNTETACPYGTATCMLCDATCANVLALTGARCGDGAVLAGTETCDDGNTTTETGCTYGTATCTGCNSTCTMALSLTGGRCGDGAIYAGVETCDDGNTSTETGCAYGTPTCNGCNATCTTILSLTGQYCGDGAINGSEQCDDGNTTSLDGCSATCTNECVNQGYGSIRLASGAGRCYVQVTGSPDLGAYTHWGGARVACPYLLYDGELAAPATAAERTTLSGAGFYSVDQWVGGNDLVTEGTWVWNNGETWSYPVGSSPWGGGEGSSATEDCLSVNDPGGNIADRTCGDTLEMYLCEGTGIRPQVCGDGWSTLFFGGTEQCDDGNTVSGDGCSATCTWESYAEVEPNDDGSTSTGGVYAQGNDFNAGAITNALARHVYTSDARIDGAFSPAGDEDVFAVRNGGTAARRLRIWATHDVSSQNATIRVWSSATTLVAEDDDDGRGLLPFIDFDEITIPAGTTYYVHIFQTGDWLSHGYTLHIDFL